jgi:hypothetical protein
MRIETLAGGGAGRAAGGGTGLEQVGAVCAMTDQSPDTAALTPERLKMLEKLREIFMPYYFRKRGAMVKRAGRFVHYTSAASGLNIIRTKKLWMRNTNCMSDYREVQHGFDTLNKFFANPSKLQTFMKPLDACVEGVGQQAIQLFNQWWRDIRFNTFISSLSEHLETEDRHGRLSMWRALARTNARVALVFKSVPLNDETAGTSLSLLLSPVAYYPEPRAEAELLSVVDNIALNQDFLQSADRTMVCATLFYMLLTGVVCLKHEGFDEEREWRMIYSPGQRFSSLISRSLEVIEGVPQMIYKIP